MPDSLMWYSGMLESPLEEILRAAKSQVAGDKQPSSTQMSKAVDTIPTVSLVLYVIERLY